MGIVLLNEFILLWDEKFFTAAGYREKIETLLSHSYFSVSKEILTFFAYGTPIFHLIAPIVLVVTSVFLICGIVNALSTKSLSIIFIVYFVSHIATTGTWVYEFVMPLIFSYLLVKHQPTEKNIITGDFNSWPLKKAACVFLLISIFLYFINVSSKNAPHYYCVGIIMAIVVFVLLMINFYFSKKDPRENEQQNIFDEKLRDKATIFIGIMLASQVHMDRLFKWFTLKGYTNLIDIYQHYSTLSPHIYFFTQMIKHNAALVLPLQASLESFLALCLVILVFRPVVYLLSALLFLALAFIEFGVPATFPVKHPIEYTWTWELLLTAIVISVITCYEFKRFCTAKAPLEKWVGEPLYENMTILTRSLYTLIISILIFIVVLVSHNLAKVSSVFAIESGLTTFFYLGLFHLFDGLKVKLKK